MNEYLGQICPHCKTAFTEKDDIVVCSSCNMPHHKSCWEENQGCTTFGCTRTIKSSDNGITPVTTSEMGNDKVYVNNTTYCTKCGAENNANHLFCSKCGNPLNQTSAVQPQNTYNKQNTNGAAGNSSYGQTTYKGAEQNTPNNANGAQQSNYGSANSTAYSANNSLNSNDYKNSDLIRLVGKKSDYYMPKFEKMKENNKNTWNWAAFFFGAYWMIYRKMYAYGIGVIAILFVASMVGSICNFICSIVIGLVGNHMYMKHCEKILNESSTMTEPYKTEFLSKKGGTSVAAAIVTLIIYFVILTFIFM